MDFHYNFSSSANDDIISAQIKKAKLLQELKYRKVSTSKWTLDDKLDIILKIRNAEKPQDLGIFRHKYRQGVKDE